jgi:hypothetical protein
MRVWFLVAMNTKEEPKLPTNMVGQPDPAMGVELVPFQTLDSQSAAIFQRLGVQLNLGRLVIPENLSRDDFKALVQATYRVMQAGNRVQEGSQWYLGALWHCQDFDYGERKAWTKEADWAGPSYEHWERLGAAYKLFLEWSESSEVIRNQDQLFTKNLDQSRFLTPTFFIKALSAPPEKRMELL